jgi:hypothetical protein
MNPTLNIDGNSISDPQDIANAFNKYFLTIAKSINTKLPYETTGKITVLYILIFKFLDSNLEVKRFCTE